jgi:predicted adenine nucleotide alpha hydrolase (AANH) superfamily ATPase
MADLLNIPLEFPFEQKQLVLLTCCAPCSCEVIERLAKNNINTTILFYNPNIFPEQEYNKRLRENRKLAIKYGFPFIDLEYEADKWLEEIKGLENEPERGKRCEKCFSMRLRKTFEYAQRNGFKVVSSTLATSRWKDLSQVNEIGNRIAKDFSLDYWDINWKKSGGQIRKAELIKDLNIYEQDYCGCPFSHRTEKKVSEEKQIKDFNIEKTIEDINPLTKKEIDDLLK